jgi:ligand-binding sensor domain-containing protein
VRSTLRQVRQQVSVEGNLPFQLAPWTRADAGFEALPAPNGYVAGAELDGKLYLAGPGGIDVYPQTGMQLAAQPQTMRTGMELPPAPVTELVAGRLRGQSSVHLLAATRGEGVLLLADDASAPVLQLLPADAADRNVTAVLALASGDLLIGTQNAGMLIYDGKMLRLFAPAFAGVGVTALAADGAGFWVGTRTRGVMHWHAGETEVFDQTMGMPDAQVEDIAVSAQGVFVGTPLGVAEFRDGRPERVLAQGTFAHALSINGDTLTVATIDQGTREIDLRPNSRRPNVSAARGDAALSVASFVRGSIASLMAVGDSGLLRRESEGGWQTVSATNREALADRNVTSLNFAADGRLWVGYFDRGVDVLDTASGRATHVEDDHVFCVNRIVSDPLRQTMDVATANGLVLFDPQKTQPRVQQVLSRRDGLIADQVTDVAFGRNGMTLATPAGLTFFTPSGTQSLYSFQGLVNDHVYALAADPASSRVVAGTLGGISILDDESVRQNLTLRNSDLKRNWITSVVRVPDNGVTMWMVGTYGGGVVQMDDAGHISAMNGANRTTVINPNAMLVTPRHVLAGSLADGLLVYDRATARWSQVLSGLPSKNVTAFAQRNGEIYIGTDNGIVRIAEARLP